MLVRQIAYRVQVSLGARMHAAFTLHAFEHNRADIVAPLGEQGLERRNVVLDGVDEPRRQGFERLLFGRLRRSGQRSERPAVEAPIERHDGLGASLVLFGPQASEFDGALVGLGTRIGEEALPRGRVLFFGARVEQTGQKLGNLAASLDIVVIAHMDELRRLCRNRIRHRRMAMSEAHSAYPRHEIEVRAPLVVEHAHALAAHKLDRLACVRAHEVRRLEGLLFCQTHSYPPSSLKDYLVFRTAAQPSSNQRYRSFESLMRVGR